MKSLIKDPCSKKWEDLHPNDKGAFCNACSKTVIDFTRKTESEILKYLKENTGQKTCGRVLIPKKKSWFNWKYAAAILAPFIWACNGFGGSNSILGKIVHSPIDTTKTKDSLKCQPKMGKMIVPHSIPMIDSTETIELLGDMEMGEMPEIIEEETLKGEIHIEER